MNPLIVIVPDEPWMASARCAQSFPDAWFPEKGDGATHAKRVCQQCPVIDECLTYALENGERYGVWGGLSETERRRTYGHKRKPIGREQPLCGTPAAARAHYRNKENCRTCKQTENIRRNEYRRNEAG